MDTGFHDPLHRRVGNTVRSSQVIVAIFCATCLKPTSDPGEVAWVTKPLICPRCFRDLDRHAILTTAQAGEARRRLGGVDAPQTGTSLQDFLAEVTDWRSPPESGSPIGPAQGGEKIEDFVRDLRGPRGNLIHSDKFGVLTECGQCQDLVLRRGRSGMVVAPSNCGEGHPVDGVAVVTDNLASTFRTFIPDHHDQTRLRRYREDGPRVVG